MDLGTVQTKTKTGKYANLQQFVADIMLIWKNCKIYNMAGSPIVMEAEEMKKRTNHYCQKYDVALELTQRKRQRLEDVNLEDEVFKGEVPFDAKVKVSEKVRHLTNDDLDKIINLIETDCKNAAQSIDEDRVQIHLDDLDKDTFEKLVALVEAASAK